MKGMDVAYETLSFDVADGVARLALNRPDAANAFNPELCRDLFDAAIACDERADIRAVLLTGEGSMFSAGGDLKYFESRGDGLGAALKEITGLLHAAISRLAHMDAPVVGADEARDMDIIDRVVADDALQDEAMAQAKAFAAGPTLAYGATKRLLQETWTSGLGTQMDRETRSISDLSRTADAREGIDAFLNKRKPAFKGE